MKDIEIIGVEERLNTNDVAISLFGGTDSVAGCIYIQEDSDYLRGDIYDHAERWMEEDIRVDLAFSFATGLWRLIGEDGTALGGHQPTVLRIEQAEPERSAEDWGLAWPEEDEED